MKSSLKSPIEEINHALDILELPKLITRSDLKKQYRFLSKKYHPDTGGDAQKQEELNTAYTLLTQYVEEFRYTFDEEEINRQFPGANHAAQFRP